MSYTVRLRPEAEQDLRSAAAWYERQQAQLGQEFLDEFVKVRVTLAETPLIYSHLSQNSPGRSKSLPFWSLLSRRSSRSCNCHDHARQVGVQGCNPFVSGVSARRLNGFLDLGILTVYQ